MDELRKVLKQIGWNEKTINHFLDDARGNEIFPTTSMNMPRSSEVRSPNYVLFSSTDDSTSDITLTHK